MLFIANISKKIGAKNIKDIWPTSWVGRLYKVLAMVLANCLK